MFSTNTIIGAKPKKRNGQFNSIVVYILAAVFLCYEMALQVSSASIANALTVTLHLTPVQLGLISGMFFYTYSFMQIPVGLFFAKYEYKKVIITALIFCIFGCLFLSLSNSVFLCCFSRLLMGGGAAFGFVSMLVVAAERFPKKYYPILIGIGQILACFGAIVGEWLISVLVEKYGWRGSLQIFFIIGGFLVVLMLGFIRSKSADKLEKKEQIKLQVLVGLKEVISNYQNWMIGIYALLNWAPVVIFAALWGKLFFEKGYLFSAEISAIFCSVIWVGIAFGSVVLGWISEKNDSSKMVMSLVSLLGVVSSAFVIFIKMNSAIALVMMLFMMGVSSSGQTISFFAIRNNNKVEHLSIANGLNNAIVVVSGAIFQPLIGYFVKIFGADNKVGDASFYAFQKSFFIIPLCFLLCYLISKYLMRTCDTQDGISQREVKLEFKVSDIC